jgi:hypothetical protein
MSDTESEITNSPVYPFGITRIEYAQRQEVLKALIETNFNQAKAAIDLGISRPTIRAWIEQYHITRNEVEEARSMWNIKGSEAGSVTWKTYPTMTPRDMFVQPTQPVSRSVLAY